MRRAEPDFDLDYADGMQGEMLVRDLRQGLESGRLEVKTDRRFIDTGNIYVERACHYPARGWRQTGIDNPNTAPLWPYYLRGTGILVAFELDTLRRLADDSRFSYPAECVVGGHPTKGSLIRLSAVLRKGALR